MTKRSPLALTTIAPGCERSASMKNGGPSGLRTDGPHQASSMRSTAAPAFWPATMPSPTFSVAPTVQPVFCGSALAYVGVRKLLDGYHAEVRRRVGPHVSGAALAWLEERTRPIA